METLILVWLVLPLFLVFLPGGRRTHKSYGFLYLLSGVALIVALAVTGNL